MDKKRKRVTMKLKSPNPLFERWIIEWRDKAKNENSKMQFCFNKALESLRKFPIPLESGKECKILRGFGDGICQMLDDKLKEHRKIMGNNVQNNLGAEHDFGKENDNESEPVRKNKLPKPSTSQSNSQLSKSKCSTEYVPKERSGGYAILLTLYKKSLEPTYPGFMTKTEIIQEGKHLTHCSFTKPDPGTRYTAWSNMKTLLSKNLVVKNNNPAKFSLTDDGILLARKLYDKQKDINVCNDKSNSTNIFNSGVPDIQTTHIDLTTTEDVSIQKSTSSCSSIKSLVSTSEIKEYIPMEDVPKLKKSKTIQKQVSSSSVASTAESCTQEECVIFAPDTFDIILYIDTCETGGSNVDIQDDPILTELICLNINYEVKKLKVGDYTWICRDRTTQKELVLPYIIERKRMDDFASSIKDGRYYEQKFRLKKSGIQNITYLIEKYGNKQYVGLPITSLYQAATNTAIQDGFCVKFTENCRETGRYLGHFTSLLTKMFKSKTLVSCPKENLSNVDTNDDLISLMSFKEFNHSSSKNKPMKVTDLFIKMLIQIKGMSVERALAIVAHYPTPTILRKAYEENAGAKGEKLLAQIEFGENKKTIGVVLSKIVYQLFTLQSF